MTHVSQVPRRGTATDRLQLACTDRTDTKWHKTIQMLWHIDFLFSRHARVCEVVKESQYRNPVTKRSRPIPEYMYIVHDAAHAAHLDVNDRYTNTKSFQSTGTVTFASNHQPSRCYNHNHVLVFPSSHKTPSFCIFGERTLALRIYRWKRCGLNVRSKIG